MTGLQYDLSKMTYAELAVVVNDVADEMKKRNPIMVNVYVQPLYEAVDSLLSISGGEVGNRTSECGPRESAEKARIKENFGLSTGRD